MEWTGTTAMKNNNFSFLLSEGVRAIFKHGFMSFAAICITVACLVIVGSFGLITYNLNLIVEDLQQENEILVCIDENYTTAEAKSVGSQLNLVDNVANAEFISRQQALETFMEKYDKALYEGVSADTMRDQYNVTLEDNSKLSETVEALRKVPGVADVYAQPELAEGLATLRNVIYIAAICITAVLLIVSLIIISNTIRLAMFDRREEIAIMKMVGATNSFIRLPFVVEGFLLGLVGALCSFFIEWGLYEAIRNAIANTGSLTFLHIVPFTQVLWPMAVICAVVGFLIGIVGSLMSIRRFLKV